MARFLGALVLCLAVAVFAVENDQAVRLVYLGMTAPAVHLAFLILAALALGAAVTVLLGGLQVLRLRRRVAGLERELEELRAGPPPTAGAQAAERDPQAALAAALQATDLDPSAGADAEAATARAAPSAPPRPEPEPEPAQGPVRPRDPV